MKKQKLQLSRQDLQQIYHEALINLRGSKHYDANPYDYVASSWIDAFIATLAKKGIELEIEFTK